MISVVDSNRLRLLTFNDEHAIFICENTTVDLKSHHF